MERSAPKRVDIVKDWSAVHVVSPDVIAQYRVGSPVTFAVGTLLKRAGDPKVYAVANDGAIHHVANAMTGYALFGETWYGKIITISEMDLIPYPIGSVLASPAGGARLF